MTDTWTELRRMSIPAGGSGSASLSVFPLRIPLIERAPIEVEIRTPDNRLLDSVEKHVLIEVKRFVNFVLFYGCNIRLKNSSAGMIWFLSMPFLAYFVSFYHPFLTNLAPEHLYIILFLITDLCKLRQQR